MANEKIIAQDVFEQSIKDILQLIADNTYNFTEYTSEEIGNLVELDPTKVAELTAVINDSVVAKNKVFSSFHTKELLQENIIEANKYADDLVANLSNIKLDIVDTLPDSTTVNKSTIYILKDSTGGTNNTLNVWSDSTSDFVEVGKLDVNMDSYYDKGTVDTLLADKADKDSVVTPDDIITDTTQATGTNVLAASTTITELDKKIDKSAILSAISATPSNENVLSEKATKTELDKKVDLSKIKRISVLSKGTSLNDFITNDGTTLVGSGTGWNNQTTDIPSVVTGAYVVIWFPYSETGSYGIQILKTVQANGGRYRVFSRSVDNGNWSNWKQFMDYDEFTTTIDSTSTDTQVPTAKAVYDNYNIKTFTKLEQLGLTEGSETLEGIIKAMPSQSVFSYSVAANSNTSIYPRPNGMLIINKQGDWRVNLTFYSDSLSEQWIGYYQKNSGLQAFRKVCTTDLQNKSFNALTTETTANYTLDLVRGTVLNGICTVTLAIKVVTPATSFVEVASGLPELNNPFYVPPLYNWSNGANTDTSTPLHVTISGEGKIKCELGVADKVYYVTISYPTLQ